jgi:hypothetical protein
MRLEDAPKAAYCNREAVEIADEASCYYCLSTFDPDAIDKYTDDGETALCPNCSVDAVLPGTYTQAELAALHKHWFKRGK